MAFACQRDSYLKELWSEVTSCVPAKLNITESGKKVALNGFNVVFEDSVLFPEGGGQNFDQGFVDDRRVLQVTRDGDRAVHFVDSPIPLAVGQKCRQVVDWTRRFDHMQQHTGQHLISAFLEQLLLANTTSWWMGENSGERVGLSYIELDKAVSKEEMEEVEEKCNEAIRNHLSVEVNLFEVGDPRLTAAHTRGLPSDVQGPIRVINIDGVDSNMCCGTHVSNLSHLQVIKLLSVEKGKKGKTLLYFLVGDRVVRYLKCCYDREQQLTQILNGGAESHADLAAKCTHNLKVTTKSLQVALREIAAIEAQQVNQKEPKYFLKHRKDGEIDYVNVLIGEIKNKDLFLCVILGDDQAGPCQLVISGKEEDLKALGPRIVALLDGKGGGKGTRMNAKVFSLKKLPEVTKELEIHFQNASQGEL